LKLFWLEAFSVPMPYGTGGIVEMGAGGLEETWGTLADCELGQEGRRRQGGARGASSVPSLPAQLTLSGKNPREKSKEPFCCALHFPHRLKGFGAPLPAQVLPRNLPSERGKGKGINFFLSGNIPKE